MIDVGSVIQVRKSVPAWKNCVMIVHEVKEHSIRAFMVLPGNGEITYLNLNHSEYDVVGHITHSKGETK